MPKMNVANFLIGNLSRNDTHMLADPERGIIIGQLIDSWEDRRYVHPIPIYEVNRPMNNFSTEFGLGLHKQ